MNFSSAVREAVALQQLHAYHKNPVGNSLTRVLEAAILELQKLISVEPPHNVENIKKLYTLPLSKMVIILLEKI